MRTKVFWVSMVASLMLTSISLAQQGNSPAPVAAPPGGAAQPTPKGEAEGIIGADSVIMSLDKLRPNDELRQYMTRKGEQAVIPKDFKDKMASTLAALGEANKRPGDPAAVNNYFNWVNLSLHAWSDFLKNYGADRKQGERLIGELREKYGEVEKDARGRETASLKEGGLKKEDLEKVVAILNEISGKVDLMKGEDSLTPEQITNTIVLLLSEKMLPMEVELIAKRAALARLIGDTAKSARGDLERYSIAMTRRYELAEAQLGIISKISTNHAYSVELAQIARLATEMRQNTTTSDGFLDNAIPAMLAQEWGLNKTTTGTSTGTQYDPMNFIREQLKDRKNQKKEQPSNVRKNETGRRGNS